MVHHEPNNATATVGVLEESVLGHCTTEKVHLVDIKILKLNLLAILLAMDVPVAISNILWTK